MMGAGEAKLGKAVVTGASSGIGKMYAEKLAQKGYDLVLVARRADRIEALASDLKVRYGVDAKAMIADLGNAADLERVAQAIAGDETVTMLVNNAGISTVGTLADANVETLESIIRLNVVALSRLTMAVLPGFKLRDRGAIVNIGSVVGFDGYVYTAIYGATKAYVMNLTRSLQAELAGTRVVAQLLAPAATVSEIWDLIGHPMDTLNPAIVMTTEDCVNASLRGLELGEKITAPSVQNPELVANFEAASAALMAASQLTGKPAPRYGLAV